MVDAAVGGSAHRVIAVTPWYGYSRQDKKSAPREPITARLVEGKTAVLVDDLIATAGTLKAAAQAVHDAGARRVYAAATHGVFSGNAWENLAAANFEQVVVTDTIPLRPDAPDFVRVLPCADL